MPLVESEQEKRFYCRLLPRVPGRVLYALDIVPFQLEATGWLLAMLTGDTEQLLTAANQAGLATEICSATVYWPAHSPGRCFHARMLWYGPMCPAKTLLKAALFLARLNDCPGYLWTTPMRMHLKKTGYLISELENLISFLEEKSGHKLSCSRLVGSCNSIKQAN